MEPVDDQEFVAGAYNIAVTKELLLLDPPATRTFPLGNSVAVWLARREPREPAEDQEFVAGS